MVSSVTVRIAALAAQQRPLYCYLILTVWIFLIIAGMYKYIATIDNISISKQPLLRREINHNLRGDSKLQKIIQKFCNNPEHISLNTEGMIKNNKWTLRGVITIIRHGDRGPLTHVKDIESVNCDAPNHTPILQRYQEYINNATGAGKAPWTQSPGPFHNFPLLPSAPTTACRLGQLTLIGIQQLLTLGTLLGKAYSVKLGWNVQFNNTNSLSVNTKLMENSNINLKKQSENANNINDETSKTDDILTFKESIKKNKTNPKINSLLKNVDDNMAGKILEGDIIVHSTRYRRALQSALALIWALLGGNPAVSNAVAHESPSLAFCSTDCACPAADKFARIVSKELKNRLETHPAIGELVNQLTKVISQSLSQISNDPHIIEDALLAYLCHFAPLPCIEKPVETSKLSKNKEKVNLMGNVNSIENRILQNNEKSRRLLFNIPFNLQNPFNDQNNLKLKNSRMKTSVNNQKSIPLDFDSQMEKEKLGYYQQKMLENADSNYQDVILVKRNMDGDFNFNGDLPNLADGQDNSDEYEEKNEIEKDNKSGNIEVQCVKKDQVTSLFTYTDWEMKQSIKSKNLKKISLLRAYGMIRHIVQYMLQMVSEGKPKFVLYSGHDKTLQYLSLALGFSSENFLHIQYASRIIIEVYKNNGKSAKISQSETINMHESHVAPLDFYFRFIMNGHDVTNQLNFCNKHVYTITNSNSSKGKYSKVYLCRIENIIRFTHEDYFALFNATNYKDACAII